MVKIFAATALMTLALSTQASEIMTLDHMQAQLNHKVEEQFNKTVDAAYFENDRSWIIDEVVVVGKREDVAPNSQGRSLFNSTDESIWSFSVKLD